ncbi:YlbF family regulator [Sinanaerobacter chloroacetimidivorans]|uniref:YlbF family regulator n=1 Tax=Sinanaerobacter chloroacetimidivorans TaxID=2818044 RepID=A0A8J8AZL0_9FIRM|nr:YlbF family regulator [Sinanaerobacter chloroacetimidivorans]MBR0596648.1 YlbF family regulator [Sinanaerobacter chloroacetimidivorans]
MNVHDEAHNLARAIKESAEYKQYAELKATVSQNEELTAMLNDFQAQQFQLQAKQMMGEELGPEMMEQIQSLYQILMKDPLAAQYVQAEMRFSMLINDVYNILGEVIKFGQ